MSVTSFGLFVVIVLCIRGCSTAVNITVSQPGTVIVNSTVVLTCNVNPAESVTWKRDRESLASCDTYSCAVEDLKYEIYNFTTVNRGKIVTMTINVTIEEFNKEFICATSTSSDSHVFTTTTSTTTTTKTTTTTTTTTMTSVPPGATGLTNCEYICIGIGSAAGVLIVACGVITVLAWRKEKKRRLIQLDHELN